MNEQKFTGKVKVITLPESGEKDGKPWVKQSVVIEEEKDKYPQSIVVESFNKQTEIDKIKIGDTVEVFFNVSAKEYKERYFGSNALWKFNVLGSASPSFN